MGERAGDGAAADQDAGRGTTQKIRDELKDAEIVRLDSIDELFQPHQPPLDAIVLTAERDRPTR